MKHILHGCLALLFASVLATGAPLSAEATTLGEFALQNAAEKEAAAAEAADATADIQAAQDAVDLAQETAEATVTKKDKKKKKSKAEERYTLLLSDSGYDYYLDGRATHWVQIPHGDEQILDTWVKLLPQKTSDEEAADGSYTYPQKYYLAHYYIRPKTQQIQFLSELEVTGGRPDNTVQGRGYNAQNWEDLTPDSIEDEIYRGTLEHVKKQRSKKNPLTALTGENGPKNLRDALEEYLNISL